MDTNMDKNYFDNEGPRYDAEGIARMKASGLSPRDIYLDHQAIADYARNAEAAYDAAYATGGENFVMRPESGMDPSLDLEEAIAAISDTCPAYECCRTALAQPDPVRLWRTLWYEHEVACLFADSNVGKSIYGMQIAMDIASRGHTVLYVDCELSDKQFQLRYTDSEGNLAGMSPSLIRLTIRRQYLHTCHEAGSSERAILMAIERAAVACNADTVIVDNLTAICNQSDKSDAAGDLMENFLTLKDTYGWSMLVLAHTPKRTLNQPLTQNDLAGSKKLFNFFDSAFAIGRSVREKGVSYVKQLKTRNGEFEFGADNVIKVEIVKEGAMLQFNELGYTTEDYLLSEVDEMTRKGRDERILDLAKQGIAQGKIASIVGCSASTVNKVVRSRPTA